jgi:serine/threonine protein kinase
MQDRIDPGTTILGRYVVERLLGEGGMGAVYVARHTELSRKRFAVKSLRPEVFGNTDVEKRFRQEAQVLGALDHPGIVSINDYGMMGQTPVMVMELLQGETLRDLLMRTGAMSLQQVLRLVREVAATLDYTHRFNPPVIHRDLKPENLFVTQPDGRIKVLDFGIAKVAGGAGFGMTQANTTMGTPQYMSPEQLRDASRVDGTTDLFALASITYECLTGKLAFPGQGIGGVVLAIFDGERPRPTASRTDITTAVDAVLAKAWSLDRHHRFQFAGDFAEAFSTAVTTGSVDLSKGGVDTNAATMLPRSGTRPLANPSGGGGGGDADLDRVTTNVDPRPPVTAPWEHAASPSPQPGLVAPTYAAGPPAPLPPSIPAPEPLARSTSTPQVFVSEALSLKPPSAARERIPTSGRVWIFGGVAIAVLSIAGSFGYISLRRQAWRDRRAARAQASPSPSSQSPSPSSSPSPGPSPSTPATTTGGNGSTSPVAPERRDDFQLAQERLREPIRQCAQNATSVREIVLDLRWGNVPSLGRALPLGMPTIHPELPQSVRECIQSAVPVHAQLPLQPRGARLTRTFRFPQS